MYESPTSKFKILWKSLCRSGISQKLINQRRPVFGSPKLFLLFIYKLSICHYQGTVNQLYFVLCLNLGNLEVRRMHGYSIITANITNTKHCTWWFIKMVYITMQALWKANFTLEAFAVQWCLIFDPQWKKVSENVMNNFEHLNWKL